MKKLFGLALLALAFWASEKENALAGCIIGGGVLCATAAPVSYSGPGDVVSGARFWFGLRAYSAATAGNAAANICNASDANCADVNTLANGDFDITTAQGSPLNCGGAGGTCTIKTLYDQTAGNNCTGATCNITNSTISQRPTLTFNCIGSKPCMTFASASSQRLRSSNSLSSTSQPNTMSGSANSTNTGAAQSLILTAGSGANQINFRNSANNQAGLYAGTNLNTTATDGSYHAIQAVMNGGTNNAISVDGGFVTASGGANPMAGTISLGDNGAGAQFMNGAVLEAGAWATKAFNSTEAGNMSTNQRSYWGF